jgi:hypothetical protein
MPSAMTLYRAREILIQAQIVSAREMPLVILLAAQVRICQRKSAVHHD